MRGCEVLADLLEFYLEVFTHLEALSCVCTCQNELINNLDLSEFLHVTLL